MDGPHYLDRISVFAGGNSTRPQLSLQHEPCRRARISARNVPHRIREGLTTMPKLWQVTKLIRSKNSGPFELTFDVIFKDHATYEKVRDAKIISQQLSLIH